MKPNKKAQLNNLFQSVIVLTLVVVMVGLGVIVLDQMAQDQYDLNTTASHSSMHVLWNGSSAIGTISTTWTSIIVIILVVGLILGILLSSFAVRQQR